MSHSTPIQDPNTPYGLNLGRPLNEASNTQFDQNQYANTQHSSSGVRDPSQAMYSEGAQYAQQHSSHHPSTGLNNSTFPQESDTITRGEVGQYGSESQARHFAHGEGEGVTRGGFVASQANEGYASTATLNNRTGGVPVGGQQQQQYAQQSSSNQYSSNSTDNEYGREHHHRGNHSAGDPNPENINATETIRKGGVSGRDATIAGFNPKDTHNIDSAPIRGKEVERISTPGPHGLVWLADQHKYVHRRELDGDTSAAADALYRKKREAEGHGSSSGAGSSRGADTNYGSNSNYNASAQNPTHGTSSGAPLTGTSGHRSVGSQGQQHAVGVSPAGTETHNSSTSRYDGRPENDAHRHHSEAMNKMDPRVNQDSRGSHPVSANAHNAGYGSGASEVAANRLPSSNYDGQR